jgi:hypothetical protein
MLYEKMNLGYVRLTTYMFIWECRLYQAVAQDEPKYSRKIKIEKKYVQRFLKKVSSYMLCTIND